MLSTRSTGGGDGCCLVSQSCLAHQNSTGGSMPGLPAPRYLPEFAQFTFLASVMPSSHIIRWCPRLLLPSIFLSIRNISNEVAVCIRWPEYWSFNFSISSSSNYSVLISLKMNWFDLLAVQGTFRSLLYHHRTKHLKTYVSPSKL